MFEHLDDILDLGPQVQQPPIEAIGAFLALREVGQVEGKPFQSAASSAIAANTSSDGSITPSISASIEPSMV